MYPGYRNVRYKRFQLDDNGGSQALHATLSAPKLVSATVSYYPFGEMILDKQALEPMQGAILILVGDEDFSFIPEKLKS